MEKNNNITINYLKRAPKRVILQGEDGEEFLSAEIKGGDHVCNLIYVEEEGKDSAVGYAHGDLTSFITALINLMDLSEGFREAVKQAITIYPYYDEIRKHPYILRGITKKDIDKTTETKRDERNN